jgi:putative transposase
MESCTEVFVHLVWSTKYRLPSITEDVKPSLHRLLVAKATQLGCAVLAVGGTADHVHVAVRLHSTVSVAKLAQEMKGASSFRIGRSHGRPGARLWWQAGYGAFSFAARDAERVVEYIERQREHHAAREAVRRSAAPGQPEDAASRLALGPREDACRSTNNDERAERA